MERRAQPARAKAAIVRTSPHHRRVVLQRHLRRLDEDLATAPVVVHIVGNEHALAPMLHAMLEHEDFVILKNDLRLALHVATRAD